MTEAEVSGALLAGTQAGRDRWIPGLGRPLADAKWASMASAFDLGRENYGTVRYVARDPAAGRDVVARVGSSVLPSSPVLVERLHGELSRRYGMLGLTFKQDANGDRAAVTALDAALGRLGAVPGAAEAAFAVMAVLHVAEPEGSDYDVGYSDPDVPFSVIVGVHSRPPHFGDLRLAEGILHECMHLQLTLIEDVAALVRGQTDEAYSPWQSRRRPVRGLLHGLYVFRVVQDFHRQLLSTDNLSPGERDYVQRRVRTIDEEVAQLGAFSSSNDLTPTGHDFVESLLRG